MSMLRSFVDIGLTTISWCGNTPSTSDAKVWRPTCVTTIKAVLGVGRRTVVDLQKLLQVHQRHSLLRSRSTAVLDAPMRCRSCARPHQFHHRNCGIAKAVAAGLHDQRETMASVGGILSNAGALASPD